MSWKHMKGCIEKKFHDVPLGNTAVVAAGTFTSLLSGIAQGNTAITRVGMRAFVWSVDCKVELDRFTLADVAADSKGLVRVLMIQDKQSNGQTPTLAQVLSASTYPTQSFHNPENQRRYNILYDKVHNIRPTSAYGITGASSVTGEVKVVHIKKSWTSGLKVVYQTGEAAGLSATIQDNNIWLLVVADADGDGVRFNVTSRMWFTD